MCGGIELSIFPPDDTVFHDELLALTLFAEPRHILLGSTYTIPQDEIKLVLASSH
jgi:hypothetical protein